MQEQNGARPAEVYGRLLEGVHIAGYSFERARDYLLWMLAEDRWRGVGGGFDDVNAFLRSVQLGDFRASIEQRREFVRLMKAAQPDASQRAIAATLGVDDRTVRRDLGATPAANAALTAPESNNGAAPMVPGAANAALQACALSAKQAADAVRARARHESRQAERTAAREAIAVGDAQAVERLEELPRGGFGTIYADPPWLYTNQSTRGSTEDHYPGLSPDAIAAMPVARLAAPDAHLHLWTTNAFLFDARQVMEAWGFEYRSCFVWIKPGVGMGNYWRVSHEFCLLGIRGSAPFGSRSEASWREWPRGRHSAKPEPMYDLIEAVSPGPYLELFARCTRKGWTSWGNEVPLRASRGSRGLLAAS